MKYLTAFFISCALLTGNAFACDPCALYSASRMQGHDAGAFTFSVSEQYTDYKKANGYIENSVRDEELVEGFSTTQFGLSYDLSKTFGIQATVPVIARRTESIERFRSSKDTDTGIGDASLIAHYSFLNHRDTDWLTIAGIFGGVKFPTGDTGTLEEVESEAASFGTLRSDFKHHPIGSVSGGRALTFGTGSYDYILGLNFFNRFQRMLFTSSLQYTVRTEGDFGYEFANDFVWSTGTGYYFVLDDAYTIAGLVAVSGEDKGLDTQRGERVDGSNVSNVYVGPGVLATLGDDLGLELSLDFRTTSEDTDARVVPETRLRAGLFYRL